MTAALRSFTSTLLIGWSAACHPTTTRATVLDGSYSDDPPLVFRALSRACADSLATPDSLLAELSAPRTYRGTALATGTRAVFRLTARREAGRPIALTIGSARLVGSSAVWSGDVVSADTTVVAPSGRGAYHECLAIGARITVRSRLSIA